MDHWGYLVWRQVRHSEEDEFRRTRQEYWTGRDWTLDPTAAALYYLSEARRRYERLRDYMAEQSGVLSHGYRFSPENL